MAVKGAIASKYRNAGQTSWCRTASMTPYQAVRRRRDDERRCRPIRAADRRWFYLNRRPPSHWRIWIGRHGREKYPLFVHNVLSCATEEKFERSSSNSAAELNTQTSTICLGEHLLIHVMSSPTARSIIRRWKLPSGMEGALNQIWPIRNSAVAWPPSLIITDAGIDTLAQQFVIAAVNVLKRRMGTI
jgi:hypothetical protein